MALVPFSYNLRSLFVRRSSTALTVLSIAATVAIFSGLLALQQGFTTLFTGAGRDDVAVFVRPGATNEGDSLFERDRAEVLMKGCPEIALGAQGQPLAASESYLAIRLPKFEGGVVNVPIRGVQPMSFAINADSLRVTEGRNFTPGSDELIVGRSLTTRIRDCAVGDVIVFNMTPFTVVGIFDTEGPFASEMWVDIDRMAAALQRPLCNRVIARLEPGTDIEALTARLQVDPQVPAKVYTERAFLTEATKLLSKTLLMLGSFIGLIMGLAAVFTGTNAMLAALSARTHEIGILLSIGFRPRAIFASFLLEALLLGLLGGAVGCLLSLPLNGIRTGTMNFQTFTEVAFAFRITPTVLLSSVAFALLLGLLGGAWPAWRAARLNPTNALRRG